MAAIGNGYGSEWHLLRYLGRHRNGLDKAVCAKTGGTAVEWLDFRFAKTRRWPDAELTALEFVPQPQVRAAWQMFWPQRGTPITWDAVARVSAEGQDEWLIVEAKAHIGELTSVCGAKGASLQQIQAAMSITKSSLGVPPHADWTTGYYQYCNRIAVLNFLHDQGIPARLLFIYFTGDRFPHPSTVSPVSVSDWRTRGLEALHRHVGLPKRHKLSGRIHELFLPVFR